MLESVRVKRPSLCVCVCVCVCVCARAECGARLEVEDEQAGGERAESADGSASTARQDRWHTLRYHQPPTASAYSRPLAFSPLFWSDASRADQYAVVRAGCSPLLALPLRQMTWFSPGIPPLLPLPPPFPPCPPAPLPPPPLRAPPRP